MTQARCSSGLLEALKSPKKCLSFSRRYGASSESGRVYRSSPIDRPALAKEHGQRPVEKHAMVASLCNCADVRRRELT